MAGIIGNGINQVRANLRRQEAAITLATKEAMTDITFDLLQKAADLAPIDTGNLRGSGSANVKKKGTDIVGTVNFSTRYALVQHEDLTFNHPQGGQAKYLEQPFNENQQRYKDFIRDKIKETTR